MKRNDLACTQCKEKPNLVRGVAMQQTYASHQKPEARGVTLVPGGPGKLVNCLKCPSCGHSITTPAA